MTAPRLLPDPRQIERFVAALFRYADDDTFVSLRAFDQNERGRPALRIEGVPVRGDMAAVVARAARVAGYAANATHPAVFAPPVATFVGPYRARGVDVANGVALSVELDAGDPAKALARLEPLLGPPTVVMHSGGEWTDPATGEVHPKAHVHWRLSEPTREAEDHDKLRDARWAAAVLVGADKSAAPLAHPLRWPGSWNTKRAPRRALIAAENPAAEIHLDDALERLQSALEASGLGRDNGPKRSGEPQAAIERVASALLAIPNTDLEWDEWNRIGLAAWRATGGSAEGLEAWQAWSAQSAKHDPGVCEARWTHFGISPPSRIGAGTLFHLARVHGWRDEHAGASTCPPAAHNLPAFYDAPVEPRERALARQSALIRTVMEDGAAAGAVRREIAKRHAEAVASLPDFDTWTPAEKAALSRRVKRMALVDFGMERLPATRRTLITGSQGSGKTRAEIETGAGLHASLHARGVPEDAVVWLTQPSQAKAEEVLGDYQAAATSGSLPAVLVRGRGSADPSSEEGEAMCPRHEVVSRAARQGVQVRKAICATCPRRPKPDQAGCGYMRQEAEIAAMGGRGLFVMARAYAFLPCPAPSADVFVGDEAITLEAVDGVLCEHPDILVSPVPFAGADLANVIAANRTTTRLRDALVTPEPLAALRAAGPTRDEMLFAKDMLQAAVDARQIGAVSGEMTDAEIEAVLDNQEANTAGAALVFLNAVLREWDQPRRVLNGVVYDPARRVVVDGREERHPRLRVFRLRPLRGVTRDTAVLLTDGTGSERLNRVLVPGIEHHRVAIERDAHVTGTRGKSYSRQSVTGEDRHGKPIENKAEDARRLRGDLKHVAARLPGDTVVIASKKAADKLREDGVTPDPEHVAHFGKVRGRNTWERCASALIVGAESVSIEAIEDLARPFMVDDPEPFTSFAGPVDESWPYKHWPFWATRGRRMRDGTVFPVEVPVHPDPRVQEVLEQVREAETLQALDRPRPIFNRRTLVLCNNLVQDLTYDRVVTHRELVAGGSRFERVFAELGVLPLGGPALHALRSDLFLTEKAAERALDEAGLKLPKPQIASYLGFGELFAYRRKGQRGSDSRVLIDTRRHPVPRLALEALFGPLAADPVLLSPEPPPVPEPPRPSPPPPSPPGPPSPGERARPEPLHVGPVVPPGAGVVPVPLAAAVGGPAMAVPPEASPDDAPGDWLVLGPVLRGGAVPGFDATWRGSGGD